MTADVWFAIGTFCLDGHEACPALLVDDGLLDLRREFGPHATTRDLLGGWDEALPRLRKLAREPKEDLRSVDGVRSLSPVRPDQVLCAGANYRRHTLEMLVASARERGGETVSEEELWADAEADLKRRSGPERSPFLFAANGRTLSGACDDIVLWGPGHQHDWELELVVVIGRAGHDIPRSRAKDYIAGWTISNDISTRDVMFRPGMRMSDFMRSKLRPTFFPTGPWIVPNEFVDDYRTLRLTLSVNGDVMQDDVAGNMEYDVAALIAYASSLTPLAPGDLLLTGSPPGNAAINGNRWLQSGDVIQSSITGLGVQRNLCTEDPRADESVGSVSDSPLARQEARNEP